MTDERIQRIRVAQDRLEEVCQMIESLIDGHVLGRHATETVAELREISHSDVRPGSLRNMMRALETNEGMPGWTRPLDSVKNVYR